MRIAFDLDAALRNRHSGFYTFASGFLKGMDRIEERPDMLLVFQKRYQEEAETILAGKGPWAKARPCRFKFRWIQKMWQFLPMPSMETLIGEFDLYHCFHNFMPPKGKGIQLLTVHDLRRYILPRLYPKSRLRPFETAVRRADHFIAISEATKKDLCNIFDIEPQKVDVVYLASDLKIPHLTIQELEKEKQALINKHKLPFSDYLITFSSKDSRKNIKRTAKAFEAARKQLPGEIGLVILGRLPPGSSIGSTHVFTPGPVDDIIPWLTCSKGLIYTSLYEGFGLPILEGFSARIPVITSNCSSMPEVANGAAILVDPIDTRQIRDAIKRVVLDQDQANTLVVAGIRRLKDFSWERSARQTVEIYKRLIGLKKQA